jgi:hypothetical protein
MSASVQSLVVAAIVAACAWRVFARYAPRSAWRLQAALSFAFERPGRPAWSRRIGAWLRPAVPTATACGSGASSACSACGSCAPAPADAPSPKSIPVRLA